MARLGNHWRIERFTLNGTPMAYFPEGVHQTRGGIRVACAFVLSYADSASALIAAATIGGRRGGNAGIVESARLNDGRT